MKLFYLNAALSFLFILHANAQQRPSGLLTDLLQGTDKVYVNGYPSNLRLGEIENAIEAVQFAEVRSARPSFSWIVPGDANGTMQTGYRIIVAESPKDAEAGNGTIWDSKHVKSAASVGVLFGAEGLQPSKTYYWRVKTFTNTGAESEWSEVKAFRTASRLSAYQSSYEPLLKTMQMPAKVTTVGESKVFDFGKDAFGQVMISMGTANDNDTVQVSLG
ncbi:MAG: alpha-L-rhamnosidase, partial [Chitinophagaceae bacterium]